MIKSAILCPVCKDFIIAKSDNSGECKGCKTEFQIDFENLILIIRSKHFTIREAVLCPVCKDFITSLECNDSILACLKCKKRFKIQIENTALILADEENEK